MGEPDESTDIEPPIEPLGPPDTLRATLDLATRAAPLQVGDFEIDDEGRVRPRADGSPLAFGFSYRGADFIARIQSTPEPRVSLTAELGKLPYSAGIGERRRLARRIVEATERLPHGRISLSDDQDMILTAEAPAAAPLTPADLMATLAALLLDFKPYLDLLNLAVNSPSAQATED